MQMYQARTRRFNSYLENQVWLSFAKEYTLKPQMLIYTSFHFSNTYLTTNAPMQLP